MGLSGWNANYDVLGTGAIDIILLCYSFLLQVRVNFCFVRALMMVYSSLLKVLTLGHVCMERKKGGRRGVFFYNVESLT